MGWYGSTFAYCGASLREVTTNTPLKVTIPIPKMTTVTTNAAIPKPTEGHQLAHHIWGHLDLATLSLEQIVFQMTNLENDLLKIVGVAPRYMRLPYGSGVDNPLVMDTLTSVSTQESLNKYKEASKPPGVHIALQHDTTENTAHSLGPEAVKLVRSLGFKITTVGECLGENISSSWCNT
ncbi:8445_t:CDS:2 [Diversispora eburnea]|uniref:8445_t:CDS:1 n=1 Tax=Diversispora eburnea TaxID=1213867 RepID=A0A9N9FCS1_9GLOM|nr:8445_t:CDS:2 [Diversispora eburnea]